MGCGEGQVREEGPIRVIPLFQVVYHLVGKGRGRVEVGRNMIRFFRWNSLSFIQNLPSFMPANQPWEGSSS